ncbi:MAG: hypothetical protein HQL38_00710 [Alphaproteobacteria bacterium]|nr:hypothetical protein [Alphaproteobacteria bacterium]MBF0391175.1 hypothetical protein [Alphaproteobacteria bacterium]
MRTVFNIEMDDRTVLWPEGKFLSHVTLQEGGDESLRLDAVFLFNESRDDTLIAALNHDDAWELGRCLLEAVYQGRTQHVLSDTAKIAVVFNPNGFVLRFGEGHALKELFIASPAIIRLCQGVLRAVDTLGAPAAN